MKTTNFEVIEQKVFKNTLEMQSYLSGGSTNKKYKDLYGDTTLSLTTTRKGINFTSTKSFEEAESLLVNGDDKFLAPLADGMNFQTNRRQEQSSKRRQTLSIVGYAPCVPAAIQGLPLSMYSTTRTAEKKPAAITVVVNTASAYKVTKDAIINTQRNFLAAIIALENSGIRCNIYAGVISSVMLYAVGMFLKIKDAGQKLNIVNCAYALCNPSFLRRHFFRFIEVSTAKNIRSFYNSYGFPVYNAAKVNAVCAAAGIKPDVILSTQDCLNSSREQINEKIKAQLNAVNF